MMSYFCRLFLLLLLLFSCGAVFASNHQVLTLGVIANRPKAEEQQRWQPLADYLTRSLQVKKVELRVLNFAEVHQQLQHYELDFVLMSASYYVRVHENNVLARAVATLVESNQGEPVPAFGGVIFCLRERSDINSLEDLKSQKIAIVNQMSFGGYQMQAYELAKKGIKLQLPQLLETDMPQDNVVNAVLQGRADVGFVRSDTLERMAKADKLYLNQFKIINLQNLPSYPYKLSTTLYPQWPFVAMPSIDFVLARKVSASLLLLEPDHPAMRAAGLYGFSVPADYTPVMELLRTLRLPPFDTLPNFTLADVWQRYRLPLLVLMITGGAIVFLLLLLLIKNRQLYFAQQQIHKTEQRFTQMVNRMPIPLAFTNSQNQIVYFNERFAKVFGYSREDIPTLTEWLLLAYPDADYRQQCLGEWRQAIDHAIAEDSDIHGREYNVTCKDGQSRVMIISGIIEENGVLATFVDLTEHKQVEQALEESEERFKLFMNTLPAAVFIKNADSTTVYCNRFMEEILGAKQCLHKTVKELFPLDVALKMRADDLRALETGYLVREEQVQRVDGQTRLYETHKFRIPRQGQPPLIGGIAIDITDRRQAETELEQYRQHLEQLVKERTAELEQAKNTADAANHAKSVFIASMSHELRTPLNAVLGFSELMAQDQTLNEKQKETLAIINRSGAYLLNMINDVLDISKIEAGRMEVNNQTFDLPKLLHEISDMIKVRATHKQLNFRLEMPPDVPQYINTDSGKLRQVLINLLGNAVKFTAQGQISLRCHSLPLPVVARVMLEIEVMDSGPGIPAENLDHLFKPFVQLARRDLGLEGTGLGLTISKSLLKLMDGKISVSSMLGAGSTFKIALPVSVVDAAELAVEANWHPVKSIAPHQPEYRLLVVDDNAENRLLLETMLTQVGFQVELANNGQEAIDKFKKYQPDLIWMDMQMPVMDGYAATAKIRLLPGGDRVKIVAVSASVFTQQHDEMIKAGCDAVIHKPFLASEVFATLNKYLGVTFIYQNQPAPASATILELSSETLAKLPPELRHALREAAQNLDIEETAVVISQIRAIAPDVAETLQNLAQHYQFEQIISVTEAVNSP